MAMNKMSLLKEINSRKTDPGKLILAVKKHPAVWNPRVQEYKVKKSKQAAWNQIANEVIEDWNDLSRSERQMTLRFLIKRWNNIRDYYLKSLKAHRRKKYTFAKHLAFLHPEIERKMHFQLAMNQSDNFKIETLDDDVEVLEEKPSEDDAEEEEEVIQDDYVTFVDSFDHNYEDSNHARRRETLQYDDVPEKEEDADLMFLKSLLPDMKKLADEEKFAFKYAIMQAYMDILNKRNS